MEFWINKQTISIDYYVPLCHLLPHLFLLVRSQKGVSLPNSVSASSTFPSDMALHSSSLKSGFLFFSVDISFPLFSLKRKYAVHRRSRLVLPKAPVRHTLQPLCDLSATDNLHQSQRSQQGPQSVPARLQRSRRLIGDLVATKSVAARF